VAGGTGSDYVVRPGLAKVVDRSLGAFFWDGVRVSLHRLGQALQFARTVRRQAEAARLRAEWAKRGIQVAPVITGGEG
jgi:hypothetical protein